MTIRGRHYGRFWRDTCGFVSVGEAFAALVLAGATVYGYDAIRLYQVEDETRYAAELASRVAAMDFAGGLRDGIPQDEAADLARSQAHTVFVRHAGIDTDGDTAPHLDVDLDTRKNEARVTVRATGTIETTLLSIVGVNQLNYAIEMTASSVIARPELPPPPPKPELAGAP